MREVLSKRVQWRLQWPLRQQQASAHATEWDIAVRLQMVSGACQ